MTTRLAAMMPRSIFDNGDGQGGVGGGDGCWAPLAECFSLRLQKGGCCGTRAIEKTSCRDKLPWGTVMRPQLSTPLQNAVLV